MTPTPATDTPLPHDPVSDRVLGPVLAPLGRAVAGVVPGVVLPLAGLAAAVLALATLMAGSRGVGGVAILLAALFDVAGASVRRPGAGGRFAAVIDGVADRYADTAILAGMAAWSHAHEDLPVPLAIGFVALIGAISLAYATARTHASAGHHAARLLFSWAGRDIWMLIAAAGVFSGQVYWALVLLALLPNAAVLWALLRLPALMRD
ncbi:MAG: hypothetical protein HYX51_07950 [Chloroflexi bacterium]|nr:hypothetical protein [Chloroflexota bacterium]